MPKIRIGVVKPLDPPVRRVPTMKHKKGAVPHGKSVSLYHLTSKKNADHIMKHGFQPQTHKGAYQDKAWFSTHKDAMRSLRDAHTDMKEYGRTQYGTSAVHVKVPYKHTHDRVVSRKGVGTYTVPFGKLKKAKVTRVL
jgi:hypothetical protein